MSIELPGELAELAAGAGLNWPEADEDKLREQAGAWRAAQSKLHSLAADADRTAGAAVDALSGPTAEAARKMWSNFAHGELVSSARAAGEAADRLTHAADQVGAAKVEMVRHLVDAAKLRDAAEIAAASGHPTALLGVDTALHKTAANLASLTHNLADAVAPTREVPAVTDAASGAVAGVVDTAPPLLDAAPGVTDAVSGAVAGIADIAPPAGDVPDATGPMPQLGHSSVPDMGTGPIQTGQYGGLLAQAGFDDVPTPPAGHRLPGGTIAAGFADGSYQPGPVPPPSSSPVWQPPPAVGMSGAALAVPPPSGVMPGLGGGTALSPGPARGAAPPRAADALGAPGSADAGLTGRRAEAGQGGRRARGAMSSGRAAEAGLVGRRVENASPPGSAADDGPGGHPAERGPARGRAAETAPPGRSAHTVTPGRPGEAPMNRSSGGRPGHPVEAPWGGVPGTAPIPHHGNPYVPTESKPPLGAPRQERASIVALFLVHMFPIGHLPVATVRPARQLPLPAPELDYAAGLRFPPHDHPRSDLIDSTDALANVRDRPRVRKWRV
ncbi:WXG100-like domain-containing protein, partial [Amycolatopsis pithecellobii]|uniref:WXG100-like domain-containing protein n=1 Tax=Amycolatopsis pithecellobii TaxID=664692 RepID=UPI00406BA3A2